MTTTLITAVVGLVAAIIGAVIGGHYAMRAAKSTQEHVSKTEREKRDLEKKESQEKRKELADAELKSCLADYIFYTLESNLDKVDRIEAQREELRQRIHIKNLMSILDLNESLEEDIKKTLETGEKRTRYPLVVDMMDFDKRLETLRAFNPKVWSYIESKIENLEEMENRHNATSPENKIDAVINNEIPK